MVKTLLDQILLLPKEQRAELAALVLHSLETEREVCAPDWHTTWTDELERRRREVAIGAHIDGEQIVAALRAKLAAQT